MTSDDRSLDAAVELLFTHRLILLSAHVRLDCDGLASELALSLVLEEAGTRTHVLNPDPPARMLRFLPGIGRVQAAAATTWMPDGIDAVVILDCPTLERTGTVAALVPEGLPVLNVDHHPDNTFFGTVNVVDPEASSTCELLYRILRKGPVPVSAAAATNLFAGILNDTGRFCFSNTTSEALATASELVLMGADPVTVGHHLYEDYVPEQMRLWAEVVQSMELALDGRVAVAAVTEEMLSRNHLTVADTQDFAEIPRMVSGVEVGVLLRELPGGRVNVSLRSRGEVDVNAMAVRLGGGGHHHASGSVVAGTLAGVRRQVLDVIAQSPVVQESPAGADEVMG